MNINTRDRPTGLNRLPLELRNNIYEYVIGDFITLTIPPNVFSSSTYQSFHKKLPPCLHLNRQIMVEATNAFIHRILRVVEEVQLSQPEDLLFVMPSNTKFKNLRRLEFTHPQSCYSNDMKGSCASVHDVVKRCPELQELTIPLLASVFLDEDYHSDFGRVFEHENLLKLYLTCDDGPYISNSWVSMPDPGGFQPFSSWFLQESQERGRHIGLSIDLSPHTPVNDIDVQCSRRSAGSITWVQFLDYFA
jgi:hypothetical protein